MSSSPDAVAPIQPVSSAPGRRRGLTDRFLSLFTEVRNGEGIGALLLGAYVFLLLESYYILKTVREALILSEGGAEIKSYSAAAQAMFLLLFIPLYSRLASKLNRDRLISGLTLLFASNLAIFYFLGRSGLHLGVVFFLWVGIFNVMAISQFWALTNDLYSSEQGKRLLPVIGIGSSLGAWMGSVHAGELLPAFGTYGLMLVAGGLLLACLGMKRLVNRFPESFNRSAPGDAEKRLDKQGAFRLILNNRYLFWIAILMLVLNVVNTTGEFILSKLVVEHADRLVASGTVLASQKAEFIGSFYSSFFSWVNLVGMLLQLFLVSRIFKHIGVRGALYVLPIVAFGSYLLVTLLPALALVRIAKTMENSTDYSIQNTARQALFLPTSREAKYKAKAAIDSFFWRAGDVLSAALVFVGVRFGYAVRDYAVVNVVCTVIWIAIVTMIAHEHKRISTAA